MRVPIRGGAPDYSKKIRTVHTIALIDDCEGVRVGLAAYFGNAPEIRVIATHSSIREFIRSGMMARCDVIISDTASLMDETDEIRLMLQSTYPRLILYCFHCVSACKWLLAQPAVAGYVHKKSCLETLRKAINEVSAGRTFYDEGDTKEIHSDDVNTPVYGALSQRERETVRLVSGGFSNKEIAEKMKVSLSSIDTYRRRAAKKLRCHSRSQLVAVYHAFGRDHQTPV